MTAPGPHSSGLLGRRDLVVIGAGPVGIAALWFASRHGLDAIALEAAPSGLESIRAFTPGLVTSSTALEWEIDGLPVDCRCATEITREDLLGYYARIIAYGRLRIACRQRVVAVTPLDGEVRVDVETEGGAGYWMARRVLVTPWYRPRQLELNGPGVSVRDSVGDAASFAGAAVVIVGAGASGMEVADLLMRAGVRVTLLSRSACELSPELTTLFEISGSRVIDGVERATVSRPSVLAIEHGGAATEVPCTVAFNCTGQRINRDLLHALHRSRLLSDEELRALEPFRQATLLDKRALPAIAASLPPLADALWVGRQGVHFAGTLFHVGGVFGAGILYSIETARWAVASIAGIAQPDAPPPATHLPSWFLAHSKGADLLGRGPRWSEHLAAIVPLPVPTWSRGTKIYEGENASGTAGLGVSRESRALGAGREEVLTVLRDACYEGVTVEQLAQELNLEREQLLGALRTLWFNNGLTWVPPGQGLRRGP